MLDSQAVVVVASVARWLDFVLIFDHLQQRKLTQKCNKFAKVASTFCQIRNIQVNFAKDV